MCNQRVLLSLFQDSLNGQTFVARHVDGLDSVCLDIYRIKLVIDWKLTLLLAHGKTLQEVDSQALWRWQVGPHVNSEERVDFCLGAKLGCELFGRDARSLLLI